jgi:hypothetical protein
MEHNDSRQNFNCQIAHENMYVDSQKRSEKFLATSQNCFDNLECFETFWMEIMVSEFKFQELEKIVQNADYSTFVLPFLKGDIQPSLF